jgi:hypothetical protein
MGRTMTEVIVGAHDKYMYIQKPNTRREKYMMKERTYDNYLMINEQETCVPMPGAKR